MKVLAARATLTIITLAAVFSVAASPAGAGYRATTNRVWGGELESVTPVTPSGYWMAGYYFTQPNSLVAYGLIERWNGTKGVVTPAASAQHAKFQSISGVSSQDVWVVGTRTWPNATRALIERWNGREWQVVPNPWQSLDSGLSQVVALSRTDAWALGWAQVDGAAGNRFLHWHGNYWVPVAGAGGASQAEIDAIAAVSPSDIWAVGSSPVVAHQSTYPKPYIEHWNGLRWSPVATHAPTEPAGFSPGLSSVTAVNAHDVWAAGWTYNTGGDGRILIEHWNGRSWSVSTDYSNLSCCFVNMQGISTSDIWAVGNLYSPYRPFLTQWNGHEWASVDSPFIGSQNQLNAIAGTSGHDAWAVGGVVAGNGTQGAVPIEHWNGYHWSLVAGPPI